MVLLFLAGVYGKCPRPSFRVDRTKLGRPGAPRPPGRGFPGRPARRPRPLAGQRLETGVGGCGARAVPTRRCFRPPRAPRGVGKGLGVPARGPGGVRGCGGLPDLSRRAPAPAPRALAAPAQSAHTKMFDCEKEGEVAPAAAGTVLPPPALPGSGSSLPGAIATARIPLGSSSLGKHPAAFFLPLHLEGPRLGGSRACRIPSVHQEEHAGEGQKIVSSPVSGFPSRGVRVCSSRSTIVISSVIVRYCCHCLVLVL